MINIITDPEIPKEFKGKDPEWWIQQILHDLFFLCSVVLRHGKTIEYRDLNWVHRELCDFLDPRRNPIQQLLVLMARDMLKSSIGRGMMIQWFLQQCYYRLQENAFIYSGVFDLAIDHLQKIVSEILGNQLIQAFFGGLIPAKKEQFDVCRLDEGRLRYKGIELDVGSPEKSLTGHHYKLGMIDNLCNELNTDGIDYRKKTNKRWQQLESIFSEDSREVIFETPWAIDDVSGIILNPDGKFDYKKLLRTPCKRFVSDTGYAVFSCPAAVGAGDIGTPVFPEKMDTKYLERKRQKQGRYIYSCLYELFPLPDEKVIIRPEWWQAYYKELPVNHVRIISADAAGGRDKSKSHSAVIIGDWDEAATFHIPCAYKRDVSPGQLADWLIELYDMSKEEGRTPAVVGIEFEKYGIAIKENIEVDKKRSDILVVLWETEGKSKARRQEELVPWYERRKILMGPGLSDLEDELRGFYRGKETNVDLLDALWGATQKLQILPKTGVKITQRDVMRLQLEQEAKEFEQFERDRQSQFREFRNIASKF